MLHKRPIFSFVCKKKKPLQMEGDIRSNSSDEISDTPVNSTPINNTANYINKTNSRPKAH